MRKKQWRVLRKWLVASGWWLLFLATSHSSLVTSARAQGFAGYSIPQTFASTPFNAVACTGAAQVALIPNFGQTEHYITVTTAGGVIAFRATVQGSHDGVTFNDISDLLTHSGSTVMGQGYYPVVRVSMTCAAAVGTFTVSYSGEATAPAMQIGALQSAQMDKTVAVAAAAGANFTSQTIRTPFGNSGGAIYFQYSGAGPAGSLLSVLCGTFAISVSPGVNVSNFPLATAATMQLFTAPLIPCDFLTVSYTSGGASAVTFTASYMFAAASVTGGDPCQAPASAKSSAVISSAASVQLVTAQVAHIIYVCGYDFTLTSGVAPTATAQFVTGTGAVCAVGQAVLGGAETVPASTTMRIASGGGGYNIFKTPSGNALCLVLAGTGPNAQGVVTFVQQ